MQPQGDRVKKSDKVAESKDPQGRKVSKWTHVKHIPASSKGWNKGIDTIDGLK